MRGLSLGTSSWRIRRPEGAVEGVGSWRRRAVGQPRLRWTGGRDFGFGELQVKTLHRPRSMPAMAALSVIGPLVGGIVVEPLHLRSCVCSGCLVGFVQFSSSARRCAASGPAWMLERRLRFFASAMFALRCFECRLWLLGRLGRRLVWGAASGPACCVVCCIGFRPVSLISWSTLFYYINEKAIFLPHFKKSMHEAPIYFLPTLHITYHSLELSN